MEQINPQNLTSIEPALCLTSEIGDAVVVLRVNLSATDLSKLNEFLNTQSPLLSAVTRNVLFENCQPVKIFTPHQDSTN